MSTFERMLQVLVAHRGIEAGRLAVLQPTESRLVRRSRSRTRVARRLAAGVQTEQLEQRLAMTINVFSPAVAGPDIAPWFVVTSDKADDVYVQQVATAPQDLLIADNASFNDAKSLRAFHAVGTLWNGTNIYSQMYATNGTRVSASVQATDSSNGLDSLFVLSQKIPDKDPKVPGVIGFVQGTVDYAGNRWSFTNGGAGSSLAIALVSTGTVSDPALIRPLFGNVTTTPGGSAGLVSAINIFWSAPAVAALGVDAPTISTITYDIVAATATAPAKTLTEGGLANASGAFAVVQLPVTPVNPGGIVPGTLSGLLTVDGFPVDFRMDTLFPQPNQRNLLRFGNGGASSTTGVVTINQGTPNAKPINVIADVDYNSGQVFLEFTQGGSLINPGAVSLSATYAVYNQDATENSFTFAPGHTFEKELFVDLLTPGSSIAVDSPIKQTTQAKGNGELSLRATNVDLNAEVDALNYLDIGSTDPTRINQINRDVISAGATGAAVIGLNRKVTAIGVTPGFGGQGYDDSAPLDVVFVGGGGSGATAKAYSHNGVIDTIIVTSGGNGYTSLPTVVIPTPQATDASGNPRLIEPATAYAEQVNFNAKVTAPAYDIRIADDPSTLAVRRGRMFVSSTGSLTATGAAAAGSIYVQADTSDVYVEGTINATKQSYLFRSPDVAGPLAPFVFSTTSPRTGAGTGLIQGGTVGITLGNDLPTTEQLSVASNTVDLRTKVDSMRVRAATRKGDPINGPFPYDLSISEQDDLTLDAVAASGRSISLAAVGNIGFTAALATWGDLSINAGGNFDVTAPLSTARGQVAIVANSIKVSNSVQVLAATVDNTRDDITLTSTGGDLSLTGAISAVNNVRLIQRNGAGLASGISGSTRVTANRVSVESDGSVNMRTDAVSLSGRAAADFTVDELNDITITSLRAPGLVTLRAAGTDPGEGNPFTPNAIALAATLYDVTSLDVSAPRGSVAVTTDTSKTLSLGNAAAIASGRAASMQAAGSVSIRSLAGPVVVADAPVGGGSAIAARFAFAGDLVGVYSQGTPGLFASTLTGGKTPLVSEEGVALAVGDRILLTNQANLNENGVYVVTVSGSLGRNWVVTRAPDADTSSEMLGGGFVRVLEGLYANAVYSIGYDPTAGESPLAVSGVPNRAGAEAVRVATTSTLVGSYNSVAGTISARGSLPLIDGVSLAVGDRVLVRMGTSDVPPAGTSVTPLPVSAANGVYEVVSVGGLSGTWSLVRATNIDTGVAIETGYVLVTEGSYRATATGQIFAIAYESLGVDPLIVTQLPAGQPTTHIGTEDLNDVTTFVVSSTAGTNSAAGSLGKMISLRLADDSSSSALNPNPKVAFAFSTVLPGLNGAPAGAIRLSQELPAISKAFAIDGANRARLAGVSGPATGNITIDGSRITTTRTGQSAVTAAEINGIEFVSGSDSGVGVAGGAVSNLTIGGFAKGAAVKIDGVGGILVNKTVLGRSETGDRDVNKFGVLASGAQAGGTVSSSTIVGSSQAGIRTESGATGLSIVGTTIGAANQGNLTGIELTDGVSSVGINQVLDTKSAIVTIRDLNYFTLPSTISPRSLHLGQGVSGPGIQPGTTIVAINGSVGSVVTLSKPMTVTASTKGIRFASPARNTVQYNLTGITLFGGSNIVTNTVIANNVYSGVVVQGGVQQIGTGKKVTGTSNTIYGNGRYGVEVLNGATATIIGNSFGVQGRNQGGNVYDNGAVDAAPKYKPNARTRVDGQGNFHAVTSANAGSSRRL